jgi:Uma2 family endonuclease
MGHALLPSLAAEPSLMGMPHAAERWTAEQVRALPDDGRRHEVVDGELLMTPTPAWRHQEAIASLFVRLREWLGIHRIGHVIFAPADIELDRHTLVEPDLFVVPLVDGAKPASWKAVGSLLLVVEVLSPSSARADRIVKLRRYQRAGVPEYWIVDPDGRVIERWRLNDARPEILAERLQWMPAEGAVFELDLAEYFREIWGE